MEIVHNGTIRVFYCVHKELECNYSSLFAQSVIGVPESIRLLHTRVGRIPTSTHVPMRLPAVLTNSGKLLTNCNAVLTDCKTQCLQITYRLRESVSNTIAGMREKLVCNLTIVKHLLHFATGYNRLFRVRFRTIKIDIHPGKQNK